MDLKEELLAISKQYTEKTVLVDGRYSLVKKLGEGRYGKVYLALD